MYWKEKFARDPLQQNWEKSQLLMALFFWEPLIVLQYVICSIELSLFVSVLIYSGSSEVLLHKTALGGGWSIYI